MNSGSVSTRVTAMQDNGMVISAPGVSRQETREPKYVITSEDKHGSFNEFDPIESYKVNSAINLLLDLGIKQITIRKVEVL